jgi:hypothetical protein
MLCGWETWQSRTVLMLHQCFYKLLVGLVQAKKVPKSAESPQVHPQTS